MKKWLIFAYLLFLPRGAVGQIPIWVNHITNQIGFEVNRKGPYKSGHFSYAKFQEADVNSFFVSCEGDIYMFQYDVELLYKTDTILDSLDNNYSKYLCPDLIILKIDSGGHLLWKRPISMDSMDIKILKMEVDQEGNMYFVGKIRSDGIDVSQSKYHFRWHHLWHSFIFSVDKNGVYRWSKFVETDYQNSTIDNGYLDIGQDHLGNLRLFGYFEGNFDIGIKNTLIRTHTQGTNYQLYIDPEGNELKTIIYNNAYMYLDPINHPKYTQSKYYLYYKDSNYIKNLTTPKLYNIEYMKDSSIVISKVIDYTNSKVLDTGPVVMVIDRNSNKKDTIKSLGYYLVSIYPNATRDLIYSSKLDSVFVEKYLYMSNTIPVFKDRFDNIYYPKIKFSTAPKKLSYSFFKRTSDGVESYLFKFDQYFLDTLRSFRSNWPEVIPISYKIRYDQHNNIYFITSSGIDSSDIFTKDKTLHTMWKSYDTLHINWYNPCLILFLDSVGYFRNIYVKDKQILSTSDYFSNNFDLGFDRYYCVYAFTDRGVKETIKNYGLFGDTFMDSVIIKRKSSYMKTLDIVKYNYWVKDTDTIHFTFCDSIDVWNHRFQKDTTIIEPLYTSNNCFIGTQYYVFTRYQKPNWSIIQAPPNPVLIYTETRLSLYGDPKYQYWSNGESGKNTVIVPHSDTTIYLKTIDTNHCEYTDTIKIILLDSIQFINTFSPNGDGINDYYEFLGGKEMKKVEWKIYNRFGEKIFEANDFNTKWDGKYKDAEQPVGTYLLTVSYLDQNNQIQVKSKTINLIR